MARPTTGPGLIDGCDGSAQARERARLVLETIAGTVRVQDAAARLGVSPQRFHAIRAQALGALVAGLEPRPLGRPVTALEQDDALAAQLAQRDRRISDLEVELEIARLREELVAAGMGHRLKGLSKKRRPPPGGAGASGNPA